MCDYTRNYKDHIAPKFEVTGNWVYISTICSPDPRNHNFCPKIDQKTGLVGPCRNISVPDPRFEKMEGLRRMIRVIVPMSRI